MPKNTPLKKEVRKIPKNFRLFAEDVRRLKLGAEKNGNTRCNLSSVCPALKSSRKMGSHEPHRSRTRPDPDEPQTAAQGFAMLDRQESADERISTPPSGCWVPELAARYRDPRVSSAAWLEDALAAPGFGQQARVCRRNGDRLRGDAKTPRGRFANWLADSEGEVVAPAPITPPFSTSQPARPCHHRAHIFRIPYAPT
jgi:hypothetical protein